MSRRRPLPALARLAPLGLLLLAAAGCLDQRYSALWPGGPAARRLYHVGGPVLLIFLAIVALVWALLLWVSLRRRGTLDEHAPVGEGGGERWILIGGFLIPVMVFAGVFVATLDTLDAFPMHDHGGRPEIRVTGHQWWWEVHYLGARPDQEATTANELHIPVGRPVEIELTSQDVIHSFWVPRLHGKVDLVPGHPNHVRIQADRPGIYAGECAEFCGLQHAYMQFLVVAETPADYRLWLAKEMAPAAEPATASARYGKQVFLTNACPLCHRIAGTPAHGLVAPDLTHLGSRLTLAAGAVPNNVASLHAWVTNAPSLKPGTKMPALSQFNGQDLHALVEYLEQLK